jgi:RNA polymerase primary sigma factor
MTTTTRAREPLAREEQLNIPAARRSAPVHVEGLETYLRAVQQVPLLSKHEEWELAREIEAREVERWRALLSYPPALESVVAAVRGELEVPTPHVDALVTQPRAARESSRANPVLDATALALRTLDVDRRALPRVDAAVTKRWSERRGARAYLQRVTYARRAHESAKERFVAANLRLVVSLSRRFAGSALLPRTDLIQEGNLGLIRAVERYDYRRELRFSTYASWWIRHYLNRAIADKARLVRVPVHALETATRVERALRASIARTGSPPTLAELVELTGLPEEVVRELKTPMFLQPARSLDSAVHSDGDQTLHDLLADVTQDNAEDEALRVDQARALERAMSVLTAMEAAIVRFRFGFDGGEELTLREVAEKYDLSRERIRQVQAAALNKLRRALERDMAESSIGKPEARAPFDVPAAHRAS